MGLPHRQLASEPSCSGGLPWTDVIVPKPYPSGFRDDVVRVAKSRESGVTIEQITTDFGFTR